MSCLLTKRNFIPWITYLFSFFNANAVGNIRLFYNFAPVFTWGRSFQLLFLSVEVSTDGVMENIETGLLLMAVGMMTVFAILLIVINLGKGLILLVNKYAPEEVVVKKAAPSRAKAAAPVAAAAVMGGSETAAIVSAVSVLTAGQGKVVKIEKI